MKQDLTDITVVLDRSGSMQHIAADTIGGFNTFLKSQKEAPGQATFTLVQFDDQYEVVHDAKNIQDVPELDTTTFVPRGWTALLDAIGRTINTTGARLAAMDEADRPSKVIFVIITDGEENRSAEFTDRSVIFAKIKEQTEVYSWEFVFLGANQDAIHVGGMLGIDKSRSMTYAANSKGTGLAFAAAAKSMTAYRGLAAGAAAMESFFSEDDRQAQTDAGAHS